MKKPLGTTFGIYASQDFDAKRRSGPYILDFHSPTHLIAAETDGPLRGDTQYV